MATGSGNPHNDNSLSAGGSNSYAGTGAALGGAAGSFWGPVGTGIGTAAGTVAGSALSSKGVNFRGKYARNQAKHNRAQVSPDMAARMKAIDESGLHRLAALGITPQASPSNQPMIPGQSNYGSAVSEGINTALNVSQNDRQNKSAQIIQGLQVEEQSLRNDWLRTQIANSKLGMLKGLANSSQDVGITLPEAQKPHSGNIVVGQQEPIPHTTDTSGYSLTGYDSIMQKPGTIRGQALEDAVGEVLAAVFQLPLFAQDLGYTADQWLLKKYKERKSDPYKNMGKTGYTKQ